MNLVKHSYYDWGLALVRGATADTFYEALLGQLAHLIFAATMGILFAYLLLLIDSSCHILKGWLFGALVWFVVHVTVNLFDFQPLSPIPNSQMVSDFVTASIYGLVLTITLRRLENRAGSAIK